MDQRRLIELVRQYPQIWDRRNPNFRDKHSKDLAWNEIGLTIALPGAACRDTFKSLREKYVREREKALQMSNTHKEWPLLKDLTFLDPNIVPRKHSVHLDDIQSQNDMFDQKTDNLSTETDLNRHLVSLVRKASPIWDRGSTAYPNKQLKTKLWEEIAANLNKTVDVCMLRWKALREKYIRQKNRTMEEGTPKWELLDEMRFLDKVILYRRKSEHDHYDTSYDSSITDSSNDLSLMVQIKEETSVQVPDSSINSSTNTRKRPKLDTNESTKCPEQLFGDLVAALLTKKTEREKNVAMMEIMTILTK